MMILDKHDCECCGEAATVFLTWGGPYDSLGRWLCTEHLAERGYDADGIWSGDGTYWNQP